MSLAVASLGTTIDPLDERKLDGAHMVRAGLRLVAMHRNADSAMRGQLPWVESKVFQAALSALQSCMNSPRSQTSTFLPCMAQAQNLSRTIEVGRNGDLDRMSPSLQTMIAGLLAKGTPNVFKMWYEPVHHMGPPDPGDPEVAEWGGKPPRPFALPAKSVLIPAGLAALVLWGLSRPRRR